jgi:Uma2 family endonuclease
MAATLSHGKPSKPTGNGLGIPAWGIASFYPLQGDWTEDDYLELERCIGNRMVELSDGCLEILPMPDFYHQRIVKMLCRCLDDFIVPRGEGETAMAPLPVRLGKGKFREPDIGYFESYRIADARKPPDGADLVVEVVSPGEANRERDLVIKRREYARARLREYWIVDPEERTITVLTLSGKTYKVHRVFKEGMYATSKLLKGFSVAASDLFAAGEGKQQQSGR